MLTRVNKGPELLSVRFQSLTNKINIIQVAGRNKKLFLPGFSFLIVSTKVNKLWINLNIYLEKNANYIYNYYRKTKVGGR